MAAPRTVESTGAANHGERVGGSGANWTMPQKTGAGAAEGRVTPTACPHQQFQFPSRPVPPLGT